MEENRPRSRRPLAARCVNCRKQLPVRNGRPPAACPTCGAPQKIEHNDWLSRSKRVPTHEFYGANLVGMIVGGVLFAPLGAFLAALMYRGEGVLEMLALVAIYAVGFAFLGCAFGFMYVARAIHRSER